jgi:hypothetical protein
MPRDVYFHQHCPVCGRMLQVRVNLLGHRVYCQHCGGGFTAMDEQLVPAGERPSRTAAERADELLQRAALMLEQTSTDGVAG